jgi:glycosyltransferase involved in cell wall biosynthesis
MIKPVILFRAPVETRSGYGAHSRDLLFSLREMNLFDIMIDSCAWGATPMTALENNNEFHNWIKQNIVTSLNYVPDLYIQVTVPNEFRRFGKVNIGITAGIETTVAPKEWIDGCNIMDLIITTSNFSRDVLLSTVYNENEKNTGKLIKQHKIEKPIKVLFEGVDWKIYNNQKNDDFKLDIQEDFAYLFVGHWLKGKLGQDRKDVGMLIKSFAEAFKDEEDKPALVLKTSSANFSVKERESFRKRIKDLVNGIPNPPSIYLLFGELTDNEMNSLYNHPKIKGMVSITKGEGFGRPLLEFSMSGKPIMASNWSGHKDFLPMDKAIMIGGQLTDVDDSAIDNFIIKGSKWFTANYNEFIEVLKLVKKDYSKFLEKSELLKIENKEKFSMEKMKELFQSYIEPLVVFTKQPQETKLKLPKLNKVK